MAKKEAVREAYGQALASLAQKFPRLVVLDADVSKSTRSTLFAQACPERFINFGIAEQNMMAAAAGMAAMGDIPVVNSFSFLTTYRAADQFRTSIVYPGLNVKVAANYAGLSDSFDGPTHQTIADIAWVRALPNLTVLSISDGPEMRKALPQILRHQGPVWFRLCRAETQVVHDENYDFQLGKADLVRPGSDVSLIGTGVVLPRLLEAALQLATQGVEAEVLNIHTLKPLDAMAVRASAARTGCVVTVEEHNILGGLGGAVCEALSETGGAPVIRVGIPDTFAESGPYEELLDRYGLSGGHIVAAARRAMEARR